MKILILVDLYKTKQVISYLTKSFVQLGDDAEDFDLNFLIDRHAKVIHLGTGATSPHFLLFNFTPIFV